MAILIDSDGVHTGMYPRHEEHRSECDACGKMKYDCRDVVYLGMDTHACPECRGDDPYGAYTAAFHNGMLAALNEVTRETANRLAHSMTVREGDAFLAGYYAEKRKQRT